MIRSLLQLGGAKKARLPVRHEFTSPAEASVLQLVRRGPGIEQEIATRAENFHRNVEKLRERLFIKTAPASRDRTGGVTPWRNRPGCLSSGGPAVAKQRGPGDLPRPNRAR